jgi:hypothetical protein
LAILDRVADGVLRLFLGKSVGSNDLTERVAKP